MTEGPQPILIDIADYIPAGEGANGISYNHRRDPSVMLKLYRPGIRQQPFDEMVLARKVFETGIPTPEPGDFVTDGERFGIRFRRIYGKKSIARAVGEDPSRVEEYAGIFAQMCRQLHATHVDTGLFESVKDRNLRLLEQNPFFRPEEKEKIAAFIRRAPESDTAIHGDLQYGNAIFVGNERYFIDLGDFCYGNPMFDLGMVYLCSCLSSEEFIREAFHMEKSTAIAFWNAFVPAYFGPEVNREEIEREVRLYAGLKTLTVERDTGCPMPEFRVALEPILK
ncbi:MAG: TIGR02172 family protein [Bacteroidales bacterium]|nr:TIGR02172 family protein [Bacteroidales bacterium]